MPRFALAARALLVPAFLALLTGCQTIKDILPAAEPQAPDQSALLVGGLWQLDSIGGAPADAAPAGTIAFYSDGRLVGKGGCNTFTGRYRSAGVTLQVTDLKVGGTECESAFLAQEQAYLALLKSVARYEVRPEPLQPSGVLALADAAGQELLFHRSANASVQLLDYSCADGTALRVLFDWSRGTASLAANGGASARLDKVSVASGFRFEGAGQSLSGHDREAQWARDGAAPVACSVAG